jgi:hypothetical protein
MLFYTLVSGNANESPYFRPLVQAAFKQHLLELVTGYPAFLSGVNCLLIESIGAKPRIYPKKNVTLRKKGNKVWAEMLLSFIEDPSSGLRITIRDALLKQVINPKKKISR